MLDSLSSGSGVLFVSGVAWLRKFCFRPDILFFSAVGFGVTGVVFPTTLSILRFFGVSGLDLGEV